MTSDQRIMSITTPHSTSRVSQDRVLHRHWYHIAHFGDIDKYEEMSDVIPVAVQHPVLLDVATKDTITCTGKPMVPLSLRGFRLHTVWHQPSGEDPVRQVTILRFQGEATTPMLEYKPEKLPRGLMQGPKMAINLRPPSSDHWNIISDLVLPMTIDMFRQRREAKRTEQDPEGRSAGAERSLQETPAPGKTPQVVAGGSKAAFPTDSASGGENLRDCTRHSRTHPSHLSQDHT